MGALAEAKGVADMGAQPDPSFAIRPFMTVEEVARRWGLDRKTVYAMIDRGQISSRRCGRLVRIPSKV
jgi:excisionase family DNA binding protein